MSWRLEGTYFENCSCNAPCPCTMSFDAGADTERCEVLLVFHVDAGEVDGVDVSGLGVAAIADAPRVMTEGNWRLGLIVDSAASDEQAEKLAGVFSGQMGGPMEALAGLVGEQLGMERLPIDYRDDGLRHQVRIGDAIDVQVEDVVPFGATDGTPVRMTGVFHPANSELTIARATSSRISGFGLNMSNDGRSAFSAPFSWAA